MTYDARYAKRWHYARSLGITQWIAVDEARAHVRKLMAAGFTAHAIAHAARVSPTAIHDISGNRPETATRSVNRHVSTRIMTLNAKAVIDAQADDTTLVPATGAKRRVQALLAMGHPLAVIDAHTGHRPRLAKYVMDRTPSMSITVDKHRAIDRAYRALWNVPGANARIRDDARRRGYASAIAWDDGAIDNPDATPNGTGTTKRTYAEIVEDIEDLLRFDRLTTTARVAERLGYADKSGVQNALTRANRGDLLATLARNAELEGHTVRRRAS